MPTNPDPSAPTSPGEGTRAVALVVVGVVLCQLVEFWPSLLGDRLLLPLDHLARPGIYLPRPKDGFPPAFDPVISDIVRLFVPNCEHAAREVHSGRWPMWMPDIFLGAPFAGFPKYNPFTLLFFLFPSPRTFAWIHLLQRLIAALGAYLFFRRALGVSRRAAVLGAWCYPLTGYFVFWQGFHCLECLCLFPWMLLATSSAIRRPAGYGLPGLTITTAVSLTTTLDVAAQMMLASGLYALVLLARDSARGRRARTALALGLAWSAGMLLPSAYLAPMIEYASTGDRVNRRAAGVEERPPVGLAALPEVLVPELYGTSRRGSVRLVDGNVPESSCTAYTGLVLTLLVAPLALVDRRFRTYHVLALVFLVVGLGWALDLPGVVWLMRHIPIVKMLSHNRFTFAASLGILILGVIGMDTLRRGVPGWRPWFYVPFLLLASLTVVLVWSALHPTPPIQALVANGDAGSMQVAATFRGRLLSGALLGFLGTTGWMAIRLASPAAGAPHAGRPLPPAAQVVLAVVLLGELLAQAHGVRPQCEPSLYYPRIPTLDRIRSLPPGRCLGFQCLPSNLNLMVGLPDLRGLDAVDPKRLIDVLRSVRDERFTPVSYAPTIFYAPQIRPGPERTVRLPPCLDMMDVRYLVCRSPAPSFLKPLLEGDDYCVIENPGAVGRVFVPRSVTLMDDEAALRLVTSWEFDPRRVATVAAPIDLPPDCRGQARIRTSLPELVEVEARMETRGLVVLADLFDPGWTVEVDGQPCSIVRTDYLLRGVVVPAGSHRLVFRYDPASFRLGLWLALLGMILLPVPRRIAGSTDDDAIHRSSEPAGHAPEGSSEPEDDLHERRDSSDRKLPVA